MSGSLIPNAKQQFLDANGNPLAGGFVYFYIPSTTTFKNTYQNAALSILNTNPIVLDSAGEAIIYGNGSYRQIVTDVNGNLIWDQTTVVPITLSDVATVYSASNGSSLIGYTQGATNSVSRTVQSKLQESVSVLDFGAVADWNGSTGTNNSTAFQNAINYLNSVGGGSLFIPKGNYYLGTKLNCYNNIRISGESSKSSNLFIGTNNCFDGNNASFIFFDDFSINGTVSSPGNAFSFTTSGYNASDVYINALFVTKVNNAIYVGGGSALTHMEVQFSTFLLNKSWHVYVADGAEVNSITYLCSRFEENDNIGAYKAFGGITATGETAFIGCVFESLAGQYAVDIGNNGLGYRFINCHFENNACAVGGSGGTPTSNSSDINVGGGNGNALIQGCGFAPPNSTTSNHNCIVLPGSLTKLIVSNSVFAVTPATAPNVVGYLLATFSSDVLWQSNNYYSTALNYFQNINTPSYTLDGFQTGQFGRARNAIVKYLQTTNATQATIYIVQYFFKQPSQAILVTAEIVGTNSSGSVYASFLLRKLITVDSTYVMTLAGDMNETPITSGGTLAASITLTNSGTSAAGFKVDVTGVAATTISWVANISYTQIAY
jgi:hypothetical protein